MRRILPIAALIVGARMLFGSFLVTTARNESLFDFFYTPIALALIVGGGYFLLMKDDE
jgi:hypothetical protein